MSPLFALMQSVKPFAWASQALGTSGSAPAPQPAVQQTLSKSPLENIESTALWGRALPVPSAAPVSPQALSEIGGFTHSLTI